MEHFDPQSEFEFIERLGKGHFGEVWKVEHRSTKRILALKKINVVQDSQLVEIRREINVMKKCASPHVVKYYGSQFKDNVMWILMEYCPVGSVNDLITITNQTLTEEQIATVCKGVLHGLEHMESNNQIHRDIKPHNILLSANGEPKLADFGIARELEGGKRKTVIGTPFYLAPEIIKEIGYDSRADIWALGISAIEMAEKDPPYADLHPMRVLYLVANNPAPSFAHPELWSAEFKDFVSKCLEVNYEKRPTAKQLLKHSFLKKANLDSLRPLLQTALSLIKERGGFEQALQKAKPPPESDIDDSIETDNYLSMTSDASLSGASMDLDFDGGKRSKYIDESESFDSESEDISIDDILDDILDDTPKPASKREKRTSTPATPRSTTSVKNHQSERTADDIDWDSLVGGLITDDTKIRPANEKPPSAADVTLLDSKDEIDWKSLEDELKNEPEASLPATSAPTSEPEPSVSSGQAPIDWQSMIKDLETELESITEPTEATPTTATKTEPQPTKRTDMDNLLSVLDTLSKPTTTRKFVNIARTVFTRQFPQATAHSKTTQWSAPPNGKPSFRSYPQFIVSVSQPTQVLVTFKPLKSVGRIGFVVAKVRELKHRLLVPPTVGMHLDVPLTEDPEVSMPTFLSDSSFKYVIIPRIETEVSSKIDIELQLLNSNPNATLNITELPALPELTVNGAWTESTAGGCLNFATWRCNPQYHLRVHKQADVHIFLTQSGAQLHHIGLYVVKTDDGTKKLTRIWNARLINPDTKFRRRTEIHSGRLSLHSGSYIIMVATYHPGMLANFTLSILSDSETTNNNISIERIKDSNFSTVSGSWTEDNAGGSMNFATWVKNPKYSLTLTKPGEVTIALSRRSTATRTSRKTLQKTDGPFIGFYLLKGEETKISLAKSNLFLRTKQFYEGLEVSETANIPAGKYTLMPCTYHPGFTGEFTIAAIAECDVTLAPIAHQTVAVKAAWEEKTAGGGFIYTTWRNNPQYLIVPSEDTEIVVMLQQSMPPQGQEVPFIGVALAKIPDGFSGNKLTKLTKKDIIAFTKYQNVSLVATPGLYLRKGEGCIAIPMTYRPKCLGSFELSVVSGKPCRIAPLREGWFWQSVPSRWSRETNTVGGCMNFKTTWQMNPKIRFGMKNKCKLLIVLSQEPSQKPAVSNASSSGRVAPTYTPAGFYVFIYTKDPLTKQHFIGKSEFAPTREVVAEFELDPGVYMVIPTKFSQGEEGTFSLHIFCSGEFLMAPLK